MSMTNYAENTLVDFLFRGQSLSTPTEWWVALFTSAPTAAASTGTEVTGGGYTRIGITSSLTNWAGTQGPGTTVASSGTTGQTSNNNAVTFPAPTAAWGTIVSVALMDADSAGNMWFFGPLAATKSVNSGDAAPSFAAAALASIFS